MGDCLTLEPVKTRGGDLAALREVSGQTIFPVIDEMTGYTPAPPEMAYQQIIKGVVAAEFTADELIYRPRNRRTHKRYGFSPVEQVQLMINTGLRYEISRRLIYTTAPSPTPTWAYRPLARPPDQRDAGPPGGRPGREPGNRRKIFVGPECGCRC